MFICGKRSSSKRAEAYAAHASELHVLEEEILRLSGLEIPEQLQIIDIPITFLGEIFKIHTYVCGIQNKEVIVLVHGYGGSGLLFHRTLKELSAKYKVYCLDLLGMGLSSRPEFKIKDTLETIEYFVESIEKWREAVGLEYFNLAGHSFGGYMSAQYTLKYTERVKQLFLISSAGITKPETEVTTNEYAKTLPWARRRMFLRVMKYWDGGVTPGDFLRKHPIFGKMVLKNYMHRQFGQNGKEKKLADDLMKFYKGVVLLKGGSDRALFLILKPPRALAGIPLEDDLMNKLQETPIVCYFGDRDWIDQQGAHRIVKQGKKNFKVKIIENAGHHIPMHNPHKLSQDIIMELSENSQLK